MMNLDERDSIHLQTENTAKPIQNNYWIVFV
jgi:hypothetical protein